MSRTAGKEWWSVWEGDGERTGDGAEDEEEGGAAVVVAVAARDGEDGGEHGGISACLDGGVACVIHMTMKRPPSRTQRRRRVRK